MSMEPFDSREERSIEMVSEWSRISRLMIQAQRARVHFDDSKLDRVARYSLLKTFLNDSVIRELAAHGETDSAREMWEAQRKRYADLMQEFSEEVMGLHRNRMKHRDASLSWTDYQVALRSTLRIRLTIFELKVAFALHGLGLPAGAYLASRACGRIRGCFPPADIILIRP